MTARRSENLLAAKRKDLLMSAIANTFCPRFCLPSVVSSFDGPRDAHKHKANVSARFRGTTSSIGFSRRPYSRLTFLTCLFKLEVMLAKAAIGCLSLFQRRM